MKPLKYIPISSDTNLYAINAIVVPNAVLYIEVALHGEGREGKIVKLPVRAEENVRPEDRLGGVSYMTHIPVLACHPISDTEFYFEFGETRVGTRFFDLDFNHATHWAYLGLLPDIAKSEDSDSRYIAPLRHYEEQRLPDNHILGRNGHNISAHCATMRTDYLRTSLLDTLDDAQWHQLTHIEPKGIPWSQFLDNMTKGLFTPTLNLSDCLEGIDQEKVPANIINKIRSLDLGRKLNHWR